MAPEYDGRLAQRPSPTDRGQQGGSLTVISFTIPGRVSGKGRPKFARRGKFVTAYTPELTRNMEATVRSFGADAMGENPPLDCPIRLIVQITLQPTASWSNKRKAAANWVTGKPDVDNIVKLLGDALNGIIWKDDAQIAALSVERRYKRDQQERVEIIVEPLIESLL